MGNEQSTLNLNVTNAEIKVENGELNGHAVPTPDVTKPVASKEVAVEQKSETPPVTIPNEPKPPQKEEVDGSKLNGPAHVETTPEQTTVAKDAEPPKSNIFGKMFKKKSEPGKPASENNDSVDAQVTAVDLKTDVESDKVFVNSDEKDILEEFAVKLKLQLVDTIPAQPESPSLLTKSISMESLSLKSKEPPTVEAKVPEDEEPKNVDAEQALLEDNELIKIGESTISDKKGQLACEIVPVLSPVEEPVVGTKKLVAEEMADIVEEILRITPKQETVSNINEELLRNNSKKSLVVVEVPLTASVEPALAAEEEMARADKFVLAAKSKPAVDEESWVVIEEPAQPLNVSAHSGCSKTKPSLTKSNSAESAPLLSQIKLMCTKALEDASYKPLSVDVRAVSAIHITIEMSPEEFAYLNKGPVDIKISAEPKPEPEPEAEALEPSPVEVTEEKNPPEDNKAAEKSVMNFFKTFTSPTKTSKEAKATPDASKEQSQKETTPAASTNVQETPKAPPPPPPAPPKMEGKAEPVVKKEEMSATKAAAAAETKAEDSPKTKTRDSTFRKLFRPKSVMAEEKKPVEVQVYASKSSTLEAAAKPEEPPAPKPEEKKPEKKSTLGKMFKPKTPEPKKETPAPPPVAEAAPAAKAKEEPKPAAPAPQTAPDNKSVGSTEASPNMPRKLEKRNSIQLFFKTLGQKRHSDAGMQTEPAAPEKSK